MTFGTYETVALACLVLLLGYFLVKRVHFLSEYNIRSRWLVALLWLLS
ncbi:sodium/glutamate symporter [Histophilus somni]